MNGRGKARTPVGLNPLLGFLLSTGIKEDLYVPEKDARRLKDDKHTRNSGES